MPAEESPKRPPIQKSEPDNNGNARQQILPIARLEPDHNHQRQWSRHEQSGYGEEAIEKFHGGIFGPALRGLRGNVMSGGLARSNGEFRYRSDYDLYK